MLAAISIGQILAVLVTLHLIALSFVAYRILRRKWAIIAEFRAHGITILISMIVGFGYENREVVARELGWSLASPKPPGLMGGLRVQVGSEVLDGSVEARLAGLESGY